MNNKKITSLCVFEKKNKLKTIGVIHIHNILQSNIFDEKKIIISSSFIIFFLILIYFFFKSSKKEKFVEKKVKIEQLKQRMLIIMRKKSQV